MEERTERELPELIGNPEMAFPSATCRKATTPKVIESRS